MIIQIKFLGSFANRVYLQQKSKLQHIQIPQSANYSIILVYTVSKIQIQLLLKKMWTNGELIRENSSYSSIKKRNNLYGQQLVWINLCAYQFILISLHSPNFMINHLQNKIIQLGLRFFIINSPLFLIISQQICTLLVSFHCMANKIIILFFMNSIKNSKGYFNQIIWQINLTNRDCLFYSLKGRDNLGTYNYSVCFAISLSWVSLAGVSEIIQHFQNNSDRIGSFHVINESCNGQFDSISKTCWLILVIIQQQDPSSFANIEENLCDQWALLCNAQITFSFRLNQANQIRFKESTSYPFTNRIIHPLSSLIPFNQHSTGIPMLLPYVCKYLFPIFILILCIPKFAHILKPTFDSCSQHRLIRALYIRLLKSCLLCQASCHFKHTWGNAMPFDRGVYCNKKVLEISATFTLFQNTPCFQGGLD